MKAAVQAQPRRRSLKRAQLSDEVAGHLRASIMSGALRPGTFIRLDDTAAGLGVSITPVREALLTLRGEGMVALEPNRGHVVLPLSRKDIQDIFWLQSAIAKELAVTVTEVITEAQIDELEQITAHLAKALSDRDLDAVAGIEFAFHRAFNRATGRIKLSWFLLHVARYLPPMVFAADPEWGAGALANHQQTIAALRAKDASAVIEHTAWQFSDGCRRLLEHLDRIGIWR